MSVKSKRQMSLLKNRRSYLRWSRSANSFHSIRYGWDTYRDRAESFMPESFPCWGYTVVSSWGDEEEEPRFLYPADLREMLAAAREAA